MLKVVSPQCITVFMIDFGSDHVLPATALYRELLYTNIPAFATKVMLDKVCMLLNINRTLSGIF